MRNQFHRITSSKYPTKVWGKSEITKKLALVLLARSSYSASATSALFWRVSPHTIVSWRHFSMLILHGWDFDSLFCRSNWHHDCIAQSIHLRSHKRKNHTNSDGRCHPNPASSHALSSLFSDFRRIIFSSKFWRIETWRSSPENS